MRARRVTSAQLAQFTGDSGGGNILRPIPSGSDYALPERVLSDPAHASKRSELLALPAINHIGPISLPTDQSTDCSAAIQAGIETGNCILPEGRFVVNAATLSLANARYFNGQGSDKTELMVNSDRVAIALSGAGGMIGQLEVSGFKLSSSVSRSATTSGLINCDGVNAFNLLFDDIVVDAPLHGRNAMFFKIRPSPDGLVQNVLINNFRTLATGRMGIEIISHDSPGVPVGGKIKIQQSSFANSGGAGSNGMGVSVSGSIRDVTIEDTAFSTHPFACLEVVGYQERSIYQRLAMSGLNGALISDSGIAHAGVLYQAIVAAPGTTGRTLFGSSNDSLITGCVFRGEEVIIKGNRNRYLNNENYSTSQYALIVDGGADNLIEGGIASNEASAGNFATLRAYGATATRNVFRNIDAIKGAGGTLYDEAGAASGNIFMNIY